MGVAVRRRQARRYVEAVPVHRFGIDVDVDDVLDVRVGLKRQRERSRDGNQIRSRGVDEVGEVRGERGQEEAAVVQLEEGENVEEAYYLPTGAVVCARLVFRNHSRN